MTNRIEPLMPLPSKGLLTERDFGQKPVLEAINLGISFGGLSAVEDLNLTIGRMEISGLIGPNGAGKTTIFNLLTKVYQPTTGTILLDGIDTYAMNTAQVSRAGIARTFQNIRLFNNMTAEQNIMAAMTYETDYSLFGSIFKTPAYKREEQRAKDKANELLKFFGLQSYGKDNAGSLPYGDQRKLEIARALATQPKVLLLDEPAAGMNPSETALLMDNIRHIRDDFKIAVILIEHDMNLVMNVCEGIAVINFGKTIAKGRPEDIQENPEVIEAYLGKKKGA